MALSAEQKNFIEQIASAVNKYKDGYGIKVASPIIAQAIIESGWGKSSLSAKYHNYFGLKCGSYWKGKSVNLKTKEEYTAGVLTDIRANFRAYDSMEEGVKGYFDFINTSRYANLKGVTDPETYVRNIKADGYATSSTYVTTIMNCIKSCGLTAYDRNNNTTVNVKKTVDELAKEVKDGKWGNGEERRRRLEAEGYDYETVRKRVNELCGKTTESSCYGKYTGTSTRIDEVFTTIGVPNCYLGSYNKRKPIAQANGISSYTGTAEQNLTLIKMAKNGVLLKP